MSLLQNSNAISAGGYDINNSLRFRSSASAYLNRTPSSSGNLQKWTVSFWYKKTQTGGVADILNAYVSTPQNTEVRFNSSDQLIFSYTGGGAGLISTQVFRDPSAWYHFVLVWDSANATAAYRMRVYVNGNEITSWATDNRASISSNSSAWNSTTLHYMMYGNGNYVDGYLAEFHHIDGQALTPSSFGETDTITGSWVAKKYTGTYGTNGFYLKFSDIATTSGSNAGLGKDFSGNTNYWTTSNISVTSGTTYDAMTDSPTLTSATVANYATWNPLRCGANMVPTNGNLSGLTTATVAQSVAGTIGISSGKYYWEVTSASGLGYIGIVDGTHEMSTYIGSATYGSGYAYNTSGEKVGPTGGTTAAYGSTFTTNDVIGVALDMDAGTLTFYKNNTSQGTAFTGLTGTWFPATSGNGVAGKGGTLNCGQRPFSYTPPTGFNRLNTFNLPDSTIKKGNLYMDASLWTGNGASNRTITNTAGFKPDLVWTKGRNTASWNHFLNDSVRGFPNYLISSSTGAEGTTSPAIVSSAASNGFVIQANGNSNNNGDTYVGWQWQAGQGSTSSNTSGSITSTVSVNTTAGFSIVTWANTSTNATIGHGLGVAPKMIIAKNRTGTADSWLVYHSALGATKFLRLESTAAEATNIVVWNNTAPTSTVFSIGTGLVTGNFVAYCWAEIAGFSKFGSYTGNGSADGPFVATNFIPKFVLVKRTTTAGDSWFLQDSSRSTYNVVSEYLLPNTSDAAASYNSMDFLSNGFKLRATGSGYNASGSTYIYMAFAENPFKNANAR